VAESSRRTDGSLDRALALAREALAEPPAGLLTDFDGTLSPIVADPSLARPIDGVVGALQVLARRLAVVAIVTGRAPLDARRMVGVSELLVAGNHGTEWLEPSAAEPSPSPEAARLRLLLDGMLDRLPVLDGVVIEHKGLSATVHYRNAPDPDAALATLRRALGEPPAGLALRSGRMSIELRPVGLGDKGAATRTIIERFGLRGVVVMGDDLTDLDMFAAVAEARSDGRLRGAIIGVGGADEDVPPAVADAADAILPSVADVASLLASLAGDQGTA
jgi:trehalose 6-phosphate phosphatase